MFGIEAEYALVREDGQVFCDYANTSYAQLSSVLEKLPYYEHQGLRVGNAGIKVKNWYVEGDERFNDAGEVVDVAIKGIEVRTPLCDSVDESLASLASLRATLVTALAEDGLRLTAIGFNPFQESYAPNYTPWEKTYHRAHPEYLLSEISTLSYGPDLNFSSTEFSADQVRAIARRLTYYSPFIVPFSFSSPFYRGAEWEGLSYRTFVRTNPRPAVRAFATVASQDPLVEAPRIPEEEGRIEFKAFDMVADDSLLRELFQLVVGIAFAPAHVLPGMADEPDKAFHQQSAKEGFASDTFRNEAAMLVDAAESALRSRGEHAPFTQLREMLRTCRTPAHALKEAFARTGRVPLRCI